LREAKITAISEVPSDESKNNISLYRV